MTTPTARSKATIEAGVIQAITALSPELTDFTPGSVTRTLFAEVPAMLAQQLEQATFALVLEGIETGTYRNFDFHRLAALPATGTVRVTRSDTTGAVAIPAGTQFAVPSNGTRVYATILEVTMALGVASVEVAVKCVNAGTAGNTASGTITQIVSSLPFAATVTNPWPLLSGADEESEEARFARFQAFMRSFSRGTKDALRYAAQQVSLVDAAGVILERVAGVYVREPFAEDPPGQLGLVQVYVDNGSGNASAALVAKVQNILRGYTDEYGVVQKGWVAAGVDLQVAAVVGAPLDVTGRITVVSGFDAEVVQTNAKTAVVNYLQGLQVFDTAYLAEMIAAIMGVAGVRDVALLTPTANVQPQTIGRVLPGTVTMLLS